MGNYHSGDEKWIIDEFEQKRAKRGTNYIILEDIINFKIPEECNHLIDPTHLGTLFTMNSSKNGKFYIEDIIRFANLYYEMYSQNTGAVDFLKEFQGYCTLQMWNAVSKEGGDNAFVNWFISLFSHNMTVTIDKYPKVQFLNRDATKILHDILQIDKTFGLDFIDFFDLMQRVGEEKKLMNLEDEQLDEVVHIDILKLFAKEFINGFINYMTELGFEKDVVLP